MLLVVLISAVVLTIAYWTYGPLLCRLLRLSDAPTPAVRLRDDVDYAPIEANSLLSQHFSAIAAAGPIVGPILAGVTFGWLPAMIWILCGSILVGGVHDFSSLVASIRHEARSMAEVIREHVSQRAFLLFLGFVWLALVYIIVAFTDITAASFVGEQVLENGQKITGAGVASSSIMYLLLTVAMGLVLRFTKLSLGWATVIFLPLVGVSIWLGQLLPCDLAALLQGWFPTSLAVAADAQRAAHTTWDVLLLVYCCVAAVVPMWLVLQPRGHLGGYFLYLALGGGALGLMLSNETVKYPEFRGWEVATANGTQTLFPMLFIMIACGACSGFHGLIASGTTSKQLRTEKDAKLIGYGAMLLEAMVAIVSLCCVMRLAEGAAILEKPKPNLIYATGIGSFLEALRIPPVLGISFALMAFTTFVYDTLDVCTRLGRYILQELTGWKTTWGRWFGTLVTAGIPVFFVTQKVKNSSGATVDLWRVFWELFGASNQLLAALTLLGITVWLWQTRRAAWVWFVAGIPTVLMYAMSSWALVQLTLKGLRNVQALWASGGNVALIDYVVLSISSLLLVLAGLMLIEGVLALLRISRNTPPTETTAGSAISAVGLTTA